MTEVQNALRSCMEQLLHVREEKDQIITDAAQNISAEQNKVQDLEQKLSEANNKTAKLCAENSNLLKIIEAADELINGLNESKALSDAKLADITARLDSTKKQSASFKYEVSVLQKELEIRNKEREYDLKSADAAHRKQMENTKKIAKLEAECQRLRTMVRKRLPGPAAFAKMKHEVEQPVCRPMGSSPRPSTARGSANGRYFVELRAMEDENRLLKQAVAKMENELQFAQIKYADEACKLSVVQRQLKELSKAQPSDDSGSCSASWASALMSELEHFRGGKHGTSCRSITASDAGLIDDLLEIERLEMASESRLSESRLSDKLPEWLQDILELIIRQHQVTEKSIDAIFEEVACGLKRSGVYAEHKTSNMTYSQSKMEEMVSALMKNVKGIERSAENDIGEHAFAVKSEFAGRAQHLVRICGSLLDGKVNLEQFICEVCVLLEWMMNNYSAHLDSVTDSKGQDELVMQREKSPDVSEMLSEEQKELPELSDCKISQEILINSSINQLVATDLKEEMEAVTLEGGGSTTCPEKKSSCFELKDQTESFAADGNLKDFADQEEKQLGANTEISSAAENLAACQETIANLSKRLQALASPGAADSDRRAQSLRDIIAEEDANIAKAEEIICEEQQEGEHDEPENNLGTDSNSDSTEVIDHLMLSESPQAPSAPLAAKKKMRGASLLRRLVFRKKVESSQAPALPMRS